MKLKNQAKSIRQKLSNLSQKQDVSYQHIEPIRQNYADFLSIFPEATLKT